MLFESFYECSGKKLTWNKLTTWLCLVLHYACYCHSDFYSIPLNFLADNVQSVEITCYTVLYLENMFFYEPYMKATSLAGCSGSCLESQDFGRPKHVGHEVRSSRPAWSIWWNPVSTKNTKNLPGVMVAPVIPATWEAEAGELLEPRRQRLQWAKIVPPHSSMGNKNKTSSQKEINK